MRRRVALKEQWFPVQAFFNAIPDSEFVRMVHTLHARVGWVEDANGCEFREDLDPAEAAFEGVRFFLHDDSVVLSLAEFEPARAG